MKIKNRQEQETCDKESLCKDYCTNIDKNSNGNTGRSETIGIMSERMGEFIEKVANNKHDDGIRDLLNGVLRYHQSFVHSFVSSISSQVASSI